MRAWNSHPPLVRIQDTVTLENNLAISYKFQYILIIQPRNPATRNENQCLHKNLYMSAHSSLFIIAEN